MTRPGLILHPGTPFPIGVEYYRAPAPRPEFWDGDFARLSAAGFHISPERLVLELDGAPSLDSTSWTILTSSSTSPRSTTYTSGSTSCWGLTAPGRSG